MKKNNTTLNIWWKNFLTGVLATAVGVGLTFGVNNCVGHYKQKQAQRQAAMMAIYDIDEIIRQFIEDQQRDDAFFKVAMYMYTHQNELETVAMDSLWMAAEYLVHYTTSMPKWADDSSEKVFTSSMDVLHDLGDITFYDNVQECYHQRRHMLMLMENSATYKRPIPEEFVVEYRKHVPAADMDHNGMMNQKAMANLLRKMFRQQEVPLFMQKYLMRDREYHYFIDQLIRLNQENKFLMNVSDKDMEEYVKKHVNKTMLAKPKMIVGQWVTRKDNQVKTYQFRKDHTASATTEMKYRIGMYVESEEVNVYTLAPLTFTIDGQWELEGDSLRLDFNPETVQIMSFDLDLSNLPKSALEQAWDSLESRKQQYKESILQQIQTRTRWTWANKVSMGQTGNIMFWEEQYTMPWGMTETDKTQLLKARKTE